MLAVIVAIYGSYQTGVFTLDELNLDTAAAMTLMLAATGQTIVLLRGGIDLSIGGMISLGTVIAATQFGDGPASVVMWSIAILALGLSVGALNGLLISVLRLQPFLVTLATWSILNGVAMLILPTDGGSVPGWWIGFGYAQFLGLSSPVWMLLAPVPLLDLVSRHAARHHHPGDRLEREIGLPLRRFDHPGQRRDLRPFRPLRRGAALYLTTQTGAGSPTIGKDYILPSVAAAVIGGVSLFGGRGHLAGTLIGAFILTLIGNLVFVLNVSSYWQPVASGVILLLSVLASSLAEKAREGARGMSTFLARNRLILLAYVGMIVLLLVTACSRRASCRRRTCARPSCWPPSSASSRSARPSSSSAAASIFRCPGC